MLVRAAVVIFVFSMFFAEGSSNTCPSACTCTSGGKEVSCSDGKLTAFPELPVSNITSLDVSFNSISDAVPRNYDDWGRQLKFLYLNNNNIKNVSKFDFQRLPELMNIYLDSNLITHVDPHTFEANPNLWKLILNGNTLIMPKDTEFLNASSLGWIELGNCNISYLPMNVFKNMSNLVFIRLSNNNIEKLDRHLFAHLRKLRYLHLEGNKIKEIDPDIFKTNHRLEWLYLRNNPLTLFNRSHFLHAPSLLSLDISFCNITQIPNRFFSNLHNLMSLKLSDNLLKSFHMTSIPQSLEALDISRNNMTTVKVTTDVIRLLKSLKHFAITGNQFSCKCHLFDLWLWCEELKRGKEGDSSCDGFCSDLKHEKCEGKKHTDIEETAVRSVPINTITEGTSVEPETTGNPKDSEVASIEMSAVDAGDVDNKFSGKYRDNDKNLAADLKSNTDYERSERIWNTITYSCIGIFGGMCLVGVIVLLADTYISCRKSRQKREISSMSSSPPIARVDFTDPEDDDRQEATPLSVHHGFDYVSQPKYGRRIHQPAQYHSS